MNRVVSYILLSVFMLFAGYFWRFCQEVEEKQKYYEEGLMAGKKQLINTIFLEAKEGHEFVYHGLKVYPRKDGAILIRRGD